MATEISVVRQLPQPSGCVGNPTRCREPRPDGSARQSGWASAGTDDAYIAPGMSTTRTRKGRSVARGASWISLVAATTLGMGAVDQVRTRVRSASELSGEEELRLIVQSYRRQTLGGAGLPRDNAKPLASTQRAITAEELKNGVDVSFFQPARDRNTEVVVVAWIERGSPTLEMDALEARPSGASLYGVAGSAHDLVLRPTNG